METFEITKSEVFRHPKFGNIRVMTDKKGEPWFVGKVVAEALGYRNERDALLTHVAIEDRKVLKYKACRETRQASQIWKGQDFSDKTLINESGLYSLILASKLPQAQAFKHWVTSEVLPQIRKTGGYIPMKDSTGKPLSDLEIMSFAFQIHERTIAERDKLIAEQKETISVLEPKAEYCDEVLESVSCMTMTQVAKEHGMTHRSLSKMLHEKCVIYTQSRQWMLYADYCDHGLTRNRTHSHRDSEGVLHSHSYLVWTEKGRMFLDGFLRRGLSPKEALRQVEQVASPHASERVQLEISF